MLLAQALFVFLFAVYFHECFQPYWRFFMPFDLFSYIQCEANPTQIANKLKLSDLLYFVHSKQTNRCDGALRWPETTHTLSWAHALHCE